MATVYLGCMMWPGLPEPVCAGTSKREVVAEAVKLMRKRCGNGPVLRRGAMTSAAITAADIEAFTVPWVGKAGAVNA